MDLDNEFRRVSDTTVYTDGIHVVSKCHKTLHEVAQNSLLGHKEFDKNSLIPYYTIDSLRQCYRLIDNGVVLISKSDMINLHRALYPKSHTLYQDFMPTRLNITKEEAKRFIVMMRASQKSCKKRNSY